MGEHGGRADATRQRMLRAGRSLLADVASVDEVTIRRICAVAGGSPSSFYRIFDSRERYLLRLHAELYDELLLAAADEFAGPFPAGESGEDWLRRGVERMVAVVEDRLWFVGRFAPLVRRDPDHARVKSRFDAAVVEQLDRGLVPRFDDGSADFAIRSKVVAWTLWTSAVRGHSGRVPFLGETADERAVAVNRLGTMVIGHLRRPATRIDPSAVAIPQLPERTSGAGVRSQVLDAMEELLDGRDAMELTTLDVAIAADLAQGTIYDEFGTKVDVVIAVLDRMLSEIFDTADRVLTAATSGVADRPADLVLFMVQAYSILAAFMDQRFHVLGAFESPDRIAPAVRDALAENEERLLRRAAELLPAWVMAEGDVPAGIFAGRVCKFVLQDAFWGAPPFGDSLRLRPEELIVELAMMSAGVIDV